MKKLNMKILTATSVVCLLPVLLGLIFYSRLPAQIAVHFTGNNTPDNYFPKAAFVFGMPGIMLLLQVFCCVMSDLSDKNPEANRRTITVYKWLIPILSIILYCVTILYALGKSIDIRRIVMCVVGVLFIVIGNYLPKTVGSHYVRFARQCSADVGKKLLRITGYALMVDGLLCIASILFQPVVSAAVIVLVLVETILLYAYSFHKREQ